MAQTIRFLVNARLSTVAPAFLSAVKPEGFLVPPLYASKTVRLRLAEVPQRNRATVVVDNGLFDDLSRIRASHKSRAEELGAALRLAKVDHAAQPLRADLPREARLLADRLERLLVRDASSAEGWPLARQLEFSATAVVGAERITPALWLSMGLEPTMLLNGYKKILDFNREIIAATVANTRIKSLGSVEDLPVVAAPDYRAAREAGAEFARLKVARFCVPFGTFMADDRSTNGYVGAQGRTHLTSPLPSRVIRSALVARGLMDGWRSVRRDPPDHVHLLGLGQPLILGLAAVALDGVSLLTCDATSPFKDASTGAVYTEVPVFRKLRAAAIVWNKLTTPRSAWFCPCRWCRELRGQQDWDAARKWLREQGSLVTGADSLPLKGQTALTRFVPYFAVSPRRELMEARIGHNHWVVQKAVDDLSEASRRRAGSLVLMRRWIEAYPVTERSNPFHKALLAGLRIARGI
jgi:hypothetical protein